jgi:hypothetical protein
MKPSDEIVNATARTLQNIHAGKQADQGSVVMSFKIKLAWWAHLYLHGLHFFCWLHGSEPAPDKLQRVVDRAMRITVTKIESTQTRPRNSDTEALSGCAAMSGFVERELAVARGLSACRGDEARLDEADAEIERLRAAEVWTRLRAAKYPTKPSAGNTYSDGFDIGYAMAMEQAARAFDSPPNADQTQQRRQT